MFCFCSSELYQISLSRCREKLAFIQSRPRSGKHRLTVEIHSQLFCGALYYLTQQCIVLYMLLVMLLSVEYVDRFGSFSEGHQPGAECGGYSS